MPRLQLYPVFRSIHPIHPCPRTTLQSTYARQRRLYAGSNYGGGEGDPKGENPQDQGANPSAGLEHPGPPPPSVGQGTGRGPTKKGADRHNTQQNASSSDQSASGGNAGPQPKIHKHDAPEEHTHSEEVRAHNEDMGKRHDRANEKSPDEEGDDKVHKGYWSGEWESVFCLGVANTSLQARAVLIKIRELFCGCWGYGMRRIQDFGNY